MGMSTRRARRIRAALFGIVLVVGGVAVPSLAAAAPGLSADGNRDGRQRDVIANLFEWNWPSVARECVHVLGPAGYGGVQVAPPQDSLMRTQAVDPPVLHPWWEVYQPVDYQLTSRMGTEAQFRAMVATCRAAGVKVYVDAVINHMTGQGEEAYGRLPYPPGATGNITDLAVFGEAAGLLPSDRTLVFVENHDTERNGSTLSYKDGATNILATEFMLARGYGRPQVYASFTFTGNDDSPPSDAGGFITDTVCGAAWTCLDRNTGIANMVGWHNTVGNAPLANWSDDGVNLIAFSRGNRGWIALNNHADAHSLTVRTGLRR